MNPRIIFIVFTLAAMSAVAQNPATMDILKSYKWEVDNLKERGIMFFETYTDTTRKITMISNDTTLESISPYYLSDISVHAFDPSQVGTDQSGKYMIAKQPNSNNASCYMIMELDDKKAILMYFPAPGEVIIGGRPVTLHAKPK